MSIELKPIKALPRPRREATSQYDEVLEKFLSDREMKYAEVTKPSVKKTESFVAALRNRIDKKPSFKGKIKVRQIAGKAYLEKI